MTYYFAPPRSGWHGFAWERVGFPGSACREKEAHEALHRVDRRRSTISRLYLDTHIDGADAAPARLPHLTMMKARSLQRLAFALAAAFIAVAAGTTAYRWSERAGMDELSVGAYHRLDLFAAAIDGIVNRFAHVPSTIQLNPRVRALLRQPDNVALRQTVNEYLEQFNTSIGSIAIFVMSKDGVTLSASNWNRPDSFVGEDLSFRPYYQLARLGIPARYYAIGTTRGEPGYFVSHPINDEGSVVGVAVIKIGLSSLEKQWLPAGVPALIADGNGVVILTSLPDWRLRALAPLNLEQLAEIEYTRQYNREPIGHFPAVIDRTLASQVVALPLTSASQVKRDFLALTRSLPDTGWSLTLFSDLTSVRAQAWIAVALTETGMACVLLSLMFLNQRRRNMRQQLEAQAMLERANASLERKVAERTADLVASNERLHGEVAERQRAEATLRGAQDELVHAAKLAALGQLATGITHELTQPLGACARFRRTPGIYAPGDQATLEKNLATSPARGPHGRDHRPAEDLRAQAAEHAAERECQPLRVQCAGPAQPRLRQGDVTVGNRCEMDLPAWCEPYRLEQVLVNLISNAIDAMADTAAPTLTIEAEKTAAGIVLRVTDTGSGLPQVAHDSFSSRSLPPRRPARGWAWGSPISRDIVREFGGRLSARNSRE